MSVIISVLLIPANLFAQDTAFRRSVERAAAAASAQPQGSNTAARNRLLVPGLVTIAAGAGLFVLGNSVLRSEPVDYGVCVDTLGRSYCDENYRTKNTALMGIGMAAMGLGGGLILWGQINKQITISLDPRKTPGVLLQHHIRF